MLARLQAAGGRLLVDRAFLIGVNEKAVRGPTLPCSEDFVGNLLMPFSASRLGSCEPARFARLLVGFVLHCGTRSYSLVEEDARAPLTGHPFGCVASLFESCRGYIYTLNRRLQQQRANNTLDFFGATPMTLVGKQIWCAAGRDMR